MLLIQNRVCKVHGKHSNWRKQIRVDGQVKAWICRLCVHKRRHAKRIVTNYCRLVHEFGLKAARRYLTEVKTEPTSSNVHKFRASLRRSSLDPEYREVDRNTLLRIEFLNAVCGKPLRNVGWTCKCGVFHRDVSFFHLDHIVPLAQYGADDDPNNFQLLCPNCHQCKTFELDSWI
jgi:5-methylcytosine-specific restriction endonuclease McrA